MAFLFWSSPAHARSSTSMYRALQPACCSTFHASSDDASLMTVKCLKKVEPACRVD